MSLNIRKLARQGISNCINFYNQERPHQSLNYKTQTEMYFDSNNQNKRPNCILNMANSCLDNGIHLTSLTYSLGISLYPTPYFSLKETHLKFSHYFDSFFRSSLTLAGSNCRANRRCAYSPGDCHSWKTKRPAPITPLKLPCFALTTFN